MSEHLHIVTHDIPWPMDYGGVMDLYCKIRTLHANGVLIHLHCFTTGGKPQPELERFCVSINYYPRTRNLSGFSFRLPFIVSSRICSSLSRRLQEDEYPVLLEGIHCTWPLYARQLTGRKVLIRLHNAEFEYYGQLARHEKNIWKRWYFRRESRLLKRYEAKVSAMAPILTVSHHDESLYRGVFGKQEIAFLPVFIPWQVATGKEGKGYYCLYHGNLSVNENEEAVTWLLEKVFSGNEIPFVIAGKSPSAHLRQLIEHYPNACLVSDPSDDEMKDMISKAQVHVLPSFNNTGIKLKLLNAVFNGRHCLVNEAAVLGSELEAYCHVANTAEAFAARIKELYEQPFTEQEQQQRNGLLNRYNNKANGEQLMKYLR